MVPLDAGTMSNFERDVIAGVFEAITPMRHASGMLACVKRLLYTHAILADLHPFGYEDRWCYPTLDAAVTALQAWSGDEGTEPTGWHRHPNSGRRVDDQGATYVMR